MKQQQQYDDQLKQQAIEMALDGSKPIAQIARDFDIVPNTLYGWINKYRRANPEKKPTQTAPAKPVDLEAENRKLKRQLATAQEDIDLLKKAAAYFAAHK